MKRSYLWILQKEFSFLSRKVQSVLNSVIKILDKGNSVDIPDRDVYIKYIESLFSDKVKFKTLILKKILKFYRKP